MQTASNEIFDPAELEQVAETFSAADVVETTDFDDSNLIPVARYVSNSRTMLKPVNDNGVAKITLILTGGLHSESGSTFGGGQYPMKAWVNSKPFSFEGQPGSTSSLASYLKACGIEVKGKTVPDMVKLLPETLNTPVYVRVGRTDKSVKKDDGTYEKSANLKTRDFITGQQEDGTPIYGSTAVKNGITYQGKARVDGFSRIR